MLTDNPCEAIFVAWLDGLSWAVYCDEYLIVAEMWPEAWGDLFVKHGAAS